MPRRGVRETVRCAGALYVAVGLRTFCYTGSALFHGAFCRLQHGTSRLAASTAPAASARSDLSLCTAASRSAALCLLRQWKAHAASCKVVRIGIGTALHQMPIRQVLPQDALLRTRMVFQGVRQSASDSA